MGQFILLGSTWEAHINLHDISPKIRSNEEINPKIHTFPKSTNPPRASLSKKGMEGDGLIYSWSDRGSSPSWEGTQNGHQQDALHLQIPENFLTTFLIVILLTSLQNPSGVTLKRVRLQQPPMNLGSITAPSPASFDFGTVAG
jgi:hypothetical protein